MPLARSRSRACASVSEVGSVIRARRKRRAAPDRPWRPAPTAQCRRRPSSAPPRGRDRRTTARLPSGRPGTSIHLLRTFRHAHEARRRNRIGPARHDPFVQKPGVHVAVVMDRDGFGRRRRPPTLAIRLAEIGDRERLDLFAFLAHPAVLVILWPTRRAGGARSPGRAARVRGWWNDALC